MNTKKTLPILILFLLIHLSSYSQIELKPITIVNSDTLYFGFTEWQFKEVIKKKYRLEYLENEYLTVKDRLNLSNTKLKTLEEVIKTLKSDNKAFKDLLAVKDELISNNDKVYKSNIKGAKKQTRIYKVALFIITIIAAVK